MLLDGHNRHEICGAHGLPFATKVIDLAGRDAAKRWIILNQRGRRNLSDSQWAMLAAKLANLKRGDNQHSEISLCSQDEAAELFGVSVDSVKFARKVQEQGTPELIAGVGHDTMHKVKVLDAKASQDSRYSVDSRRTARYDLSDTPRLGGRRHRFARRTSREGAAAGIGLALHPPRRRRQTSAPIRRHHRGPHPAPVRTSPTQSRSIQMDPIKLAREEFARHQRDAEAVIRRAQAENRDLTDAEEHANKERFVAMKLINDRERHVMQFATSAITSAMAGGVHTGDVTTPHGIVTFPSDAPGRLEYERSVGIGQFSAGGGAGEQFTRALSHWARTGDSQQFATVTTVSGGGILLLKIVAAPLVTGDTNCYRLGLSLVGSAPIQTATAADLTVPVLDQSAGSIVAENAATETENEPALNSIRLLPKMFQSGSAWFSDLALQALDYRLEDHILPELSHSKELALESAISSALIADVSTATVLTPTTTSINYTTMLSLLRAVPRRFSRQTFVVLNSEVFAALEKLLDSTGRPLLVQDVQDGTLLRFNGVPLVRSDLFENLGAVNKTLGVIVSALGFKIRDCGSPAVARYWNVPNRPSQTGYNLFAAHGYGWTTAAVARLRTPAA